MVETPDWLSRALLVGATSMRRQVRKAREHPWIAFFQAFALVFGVGVAVGRLPVAGYGDLWPAPGGYVFGERLAADPAAVVGVLRGFAGVAFVLLVFLTVLKETTDGAMDSHVDAVLLAAGSRSVAVGNVVWNLALTGVQFGALIVAGALAFGAGAGSPTAAVALALAGAALLATAVPLGFLLSLCVNLVFRRVAFVRDHRLLFGAPLAVGYFALFLRARESMAFLGSLPLGWYADLGLVAETPAADPLYAAAALAAAPVALVGCSAAAVPLGERLWYGDDPEGADRDGTTSRDRPATATLERVLSRPTAAVVRTVWLRVRREPRTLLFAGLPVALTGTVGVELVGRRPAALPMVIGVYGGATVGMGATLNPLGSAGAGLPAALSTPHGGRSLVRGYVLSAAIPGVPAVAGLALLGALATGLAVPAAAVLAGVAGLLAAAAAVVSMAVGVALPNLEGLRPTGSGIRPPRLWATTVFLATMGLVGAPALVGVGWAVPIARAAGTAPGAVLAGGVGTTVVAAGVAAAVAYRRAIAGIARYEVE